MGNKTIIAPKPKVKYSRKSTTTIYVHNALDFK
jgi:hypothetical protein